MANAISVDHLLDDPVAWQDHDANPTTRAVLEDLQANILRGHGRDHTRHLFLHFPGSAREQIKPVIRKLGKAVTSALQQLDATEAYKAKGISGGRVVCFVLSATGYAALGVGSAKTPADRRFKAGMAASGPALADPQRAEWDAPFTGRIDAMLLVADDSAAGAEGGVALWQQRFTAAGAMVLGVDAGSAIKGPVARRGEGIEHFGYVDGRSQPLFLTEDVAQEAPAVWNAAFKPRQFLLRDPGGDAATSLGSYFVFRKLEQNVKGFKQREEALANALGLTGVDAERAGALVVGRFEDGTPLVLASGEKDEPLVNDFNFASDPKGERCPFRAHIRKPNPRRGSPAVLNESITYGSRHLDGRGVPVDWPSGGVGLLFMAYMADIANQFEFTQAAWANDKDFVDLWAGIDPVIGQVTQARPLARNDGWSDKSNVDFDIADFVTLKGGEYFFAPSLSFLRSI